MTVSGAGDHGEQQALPGLAVPRARRRTVRGVQVAESLPVARVLLDVAPPHLDHSFDYLVPAELSEAAQAGVRVRVRFAGRDVDGYVVDRLADSDHDGELQPLRRVVSPLAVAPSSTIALCRGVADHYAGTMADVLRAAIPHRHARAEAAVLAARAPVDPRSSLPPRPDSVWRHYRGGEALLTRLAAGEAPRAVWTALPDAVSSQPHWARGICAAVQATVRSGRSAVVVVPDGRDVDLLVTTLRESGLSEWTVREGGAVVRLQADQGPEARYRAFVAALTGRASVVVGTRGAAFAPVANLGLLVCWDDDDPSHADERSPRVHTREVLTVRARLDRAALLLASPARSLQAEALLAHGWAREIVADRATIREMTPRVFALTSVEVASDGPAGAARLPSRAWSAVREGLTRGPVLIQVPRSGYFPMLACGRCGERAHCRHCHGPLRVNSAGAIAQCEWCGALAGGWRCPACGNTAFRSVRVGSARTAEELGRAFPQIPVRLSGMGAVAGVLPEVGSEPQLVVATPGAEPRAQGGYAAAALLDAGVSTAHDGLWTETAALRRWLIAASLVRPASRDGVVMLVGDAAPGPTQALVRWDPAGFAAREYGERQELGLPPAVRMATVVGDPLAVADFLRMVAMPPDAEVLGPTPLMPSLVERRLSPDVRAIVRVPQRSGEMLARAMAAGRARASAERRQSLVRVEMDPRDL